MIASVHEKQGNLKISIKQTGFISQVSDPECLKRPGLLIETIDQEGGAVVFVHS